MVDWKVLHEKVKRIRRFVESWGPLILVRKMNGILNALEMQVEDGKYQREAVVRLGEALLATTELYEIEGERLAKLEEMVGEMIVLVNSGAEK